MSSFVSERIQPIGTELGTICSPEGPSSVPSLLVPPANEETSFLLCLPISEYLWNVPESEGFKESHSFSSPPPSRGRVLRLPDGKSLPPQHYLLH